jgi:hypothetical protein
MKFADEQLVILVADFPQRKRIPDSLRTQYEALADQYNAAGRFPQIVLLDAGRRLLAAVSYTGQPAADFIRELRDAR